MEVVADLHLHSKYSRAVSREMMLPQMARTAKQKGLQLLSMSDWTHPLWFKELQVLLEEAEEGVYTLKQGIKEVFFLLSTEISSIYSEKGKLRRIHNLVFAPNFETAAKISKELLRRGANLSSDGRPIIGISSKNLLELILSIDERCFLIPCHIWTPHFGMYGSASGYDSLAECFEDMAHNIYGIETGLSSDPEMNWLVKELDNRAILSFSDAHSLPKMGREATVFALEKLSYENVRKAIQRQSKEDRVLYTIEFYPEEGKYHFSGHRNCKVVLDPLQTKEAGDICPVCKKRLTEGVLFRVEQLADAERKNVSDTKTNSYGLKWFTDKNKKHPPYVKLVPLQEIIAESLHATSFSQKVKSMYDELCGKVGSEITVLLKSSTEDIAQAAGVLVAEGIAKVRAGDIDIQPGFDGEYGKVAIWQEEKELPKKENQEEQQMGLF